MILRQFQIILLSMLFKVSILFEVTKAYGMTTIWFLGMDRGEVHEKRIT